MWVHEYATNSINKIRGDNMKVELKEDEQEIYISCMGSGIEARRLTKKVMEEWKL